MESSLTLRAGLAGLVQTLVFALFSLAAAQGDGPHAYKVDRLNQGLEAPARAADLETPQAMMETFVFATEEENWLRAAQALYLSHLPEGEQTAQGIELARQLDMVMRRALILDWTSLSDRPDAVDVSTSSDAPLAGEPRRNLRLALIELPDRTVSVRIARYVTEGGDPAWLFSEQTVENIPELYAYYAPSAFERSLPAWLQREAFWTLAWWEAVALPLLLIAAVGLAAALHRAIGMAQEKNELSIVGGILKAVKLPAALLVFAATFALVQSMLFTFSGAVDAIIEPLQAAVIIIAICAIIVSILDAIISRMTGENMDAISRPEAEDERVRYTMISAARRFVLVLMLILGVGFILVESNLAQTLGFSLLASASAIGLVFAFAARHFLSNIMASLQIAFAKTARIGDFVVFHDKWCYVERIGFTHVRLRTWDDRRMIAPVTELIDETFQNWTMKDATLLKYAVLTFDHRADVDKLRSAFLDFVDQHEDIIEKDEAKVQVVEQDRDGLVIRFLFRAPDPATGWLIQCDAREHMLRVAADLDKAGSEPPGPAYLPREREVKLHSAD